jgi:hypothetical protein
MEAKAVSSATTSSQCRLAFFPAPFDMTETRHPDGSDLDNRHRFGALAMPATAQQRSAPQILERLHALCDQDYKPACIKLGFVIGRLQPGVAHCGAITRNGGGGSGGSAYESESCSGYL